MKARPQSPPPTSGAITKRLLRALEPNAKGVFRISKTVRDQFQAGGKERENVYKLFAQCQHNPEIFMNKYSATHEKESELQVSVEFEFLTKKEMADDHNMSKKTDRVKTSETREIEAAGEGTEEMDVDLGEALELPPSSLQANCQQPATLADAADGLTQTPPPNEEVSKLLKRLGYPEVHDCKASALIDKAVGACTKRLKKLAELLPSDSCPPPDPAAQTANMDLKEKTCPQPMYNKIRSVYAAVDSCSEALEKYKADGLVDGFTEQYRFGFIGAKGDAEWHFDAGSFNRSYHRIGPVNPAKICPWCDAGSEGFPYTDVSSAPKWLETVGASDPWDEDPPLSAIPFSESFGAFMYKNDPFHVLKFGIFRDATASCVTRLAQLGFWDFDSENELQNVPDRLSRAYGCYRLWCAANKKLPALKGFTRANMHYDTNSAFAWFNTKGSEVVILLQWLDFQVSLFLRDVQVENHRAELSAMKQLVRGGLDYIGIMHSHGIWLPQSCARVKLDSGLTFARGYAYMASGFSLANASVRYPGKEQKMVALQAEAQAHFAILLAEICPKTAPPLRVYCTFDHITGRGPTGALAEFSSIAAAEKALAACRMANAGNHKPPKILWRQCGFAELPSFTKANSHSCSGKKSASCRSVDQVVQEGVQPSRLAQLRRGQKVASVAAFAASLLGLAHLVLYVFTPSRPSWLGRSRRHGIEARVALSGFLSAHPLEFPGLLLASSAVTGACEAAAQVNCSRNYRSLYISLAIAGLCYIFDESAVAQQIRAVASTGTTGALFIVAYVVYSCLDWLSNGISISEVFLGVRATRKLGLPQPWKAAKPSGVRLLPKLYAIAELMCLLEMGRSTLWRLGRLLPVLAALDELRRISSRPEQLSSPEAAQLNKGVGFWAWSALLEAALLGVLCSSWARHLGYTGPGVAFSGLATAALAAAPACVVLAASFMGWSRSESALVELTRARPEQPWERLGRYDLQKLEGLYLDGITKYYSEFYDRPSSTGAVKKLNDCEYYRIKVRLKKAGSKVLRYCRADIQKLVCQAQETQESVVPVNDVEEKLPATRAAADGQEASPEPLPPDEPSKAESEPMAPSPVVEVQVTQEQREPREAVLEDVETKPPTKEPETQEEDKKEEQQKGEQPEGERPKEEPKAEELTDGSDQEKAQESKDQSEEEAKEDKANEGRVT
ncbi:unnamed protein product [Symbiodinium sp. CCMP2592]|nr:unnamed protein product [Symbiodinium sp. CCMP2592]